MQDGRNISPPSFFLTLSADRLKLEGANVVNMDISTSNGVIQVVETIVEVPRRNHSGRRPRTAAR